MSHNWFTTIVILIGLVGLWVIAAGVFQVLWAKIDKVNNHKLIRIALKLLLIFVSYQLLTSDHITLD